MCFVCVWGGVSLLTLWGFLWEESEHYYLKKKTGPKRLTWGLWAWHGPGLNGSFFHNKVVPHTCPPCWSHLYSTQRIWWSWRPCRGSTRLYTKAVSIKTALSNLQLNFHVNKKIGVRCVLGQNCDTNPVVKGTYGFGHHSGALHRSKQFPQTALSTPQLNSWVCVNIRPGRP
jgi:hypothetical protein